MTRFHESIQKRIAEIAAPIIGSHNAFLIDIAVRGSQHGRTIEIFIDNDAGITTELCALMSREVGKGLEVERTIQGRYYLVVSSPGTDRPLVFLRQYKKHIGRCLSVKFQNGESPRTIEGTLKDLTDDSIALEEENGARCVIPFNSIAEAKVHTVL
jgi:ribosome maturation factor RimP